MNALDLSPVFNKSVADAERNAVKVLDHAAQIREALYPVNLKDADFGALAQHAIELGREVESLLGKLAEARALNPKRK